MSGAKKPMSSMSASRAGLHRHDRVALAQHAVDHAHVRDDAAVLVELGVEDQRPRRRRGVALRRRDPLRRSPRACPRCPPPSWPTSAARRRLSPSSSPISPATRSGSAPGRSILFSTGISSRPGVDSEVGVGHRLRLDALRGVHHQQRAFARGQRARDLVGEVHVARACRSGGGGRSRRRAPCTRRARPGP